MPGQWGWSYSQLRDSWRAADESGFDVVGCFDHVSAAPEGRAAWDAPSLLTAMAANTSRAQLALWVVNVSLRSPLLLAGQLAVAQAASGGRVEVGLGAGSPQLARHDHVALGLPFPPYAERVRRVERCAVALRALWRGETVDDDALGLVKASLGPLGIDVPPLVIGGRGEAMMQVAARVADGWNLEEAEPGVFASVARTVDGVAVEAGRTRPLEKSVQVFAASVPRARMRGLVAEYAQAGAETVMFLLDEERSHRAVEDLAKAVL
ncbi:LLM class flavin-dependent oxidoreductase [Streptomyces sp. NPDC021224]|uniref:LLM class flavin-dependent oxidoreductase n=1 Tax=unclassified Streptomyces TaxID=2593676 RepID=UPI0037B69838